MKSKDTHIDPEVLARTVVIELVQTGTWVQEQLSEVLKPFKMSIAQFNVLRILRGQKGKPASLACVTDKMIHKMSNTTRLVDKLLEKGLVERITCPENRRKVEITITRDGLKLLEKLDVVIAQKEAELTEGLSEENATQLIDFLKKMKK
ncbi:MarR family winged helix-turn-helix transcriptional regulator [Salinimicrobium soli]|uniref:MarR family winged helix-turn-helix transcriptional regulator n=1 Tax=Salinimicrobium soli TaxID=1254399 RepID=UPI003AABCBB8